MLTVDFHTHTDYSPDGLASPEQMLAASRRKGVDRLVVTDHNTIQGALAAREIDPQRVIVGEEIMTQQGELLAVFVQEQVPAGLAPQQAIGLLKEQGAFISVSHPFDKMRKGHWELQDLLKILPDLDAIEGFNARCWSKNYNQIALDFAREHQLLVTAGSDAHAPFEVGMATLTIPDFSNPDELRRALQEAQPHFHQSGLWVHFFSRFARLQKWFVQEDR